MSSSQDAGDSAKLREALKELQSRLVAGVYDGSIDCHAALEVVEKALAKPPRNCDVGTAEEQEERYINLKREHIDRLTRCPAVGPSFFPDSLYWAQMPYEEGANNGSK